MLYKQYFTFVHIYLLTLRRIYERSIASTGPYQGHSQSMLTWTWYGVGMEEVRRRYGAGNMCA